MAITAKLYETALGSDESPWATDSDSNTITREITNAATSTLTCNVVDSEDDIYITISPAGERMRAYQTTQSTFADGVVRGTFKASASGGNNNHRMGVLLRTGLMVTIGGQGSGGISVIDARNFTGFTFIANTPITFAADTWYDLDVYGNGGTLKVLYYDASVLPPATDYKTVNWTWTTTNASYPTSAGNAGICVSNNHNAADIWRAKNILAYASTASVALPTPTLTPASTQLAVATADAAAKDKRAALWYFYRYKATSQPSDENDGTLVTGAGTGLSGGAITSAGIFLDAPASFNITGLSNGTVYYVRPFAVMGDGTIVAGTAVSATPSGGDITAPDAPTDFVAAYADPFVDSRIDLAWTNPSEAGDYKINYRTDGVSPTSDTDASATTLQAYTAYTADSAGSHSATSLTDGTRYYFAIWHKDSAGNISTGAFVNKVAVHQVTLSEPADAATGIQINPYLVWETSAGEAEDDLPVHYQVEVSTSEDSEVDFVANRVLIWSSMLDGVTGFEYESSAGVWQALPIGGLAVTDVGKDVRYHADTLTSTGQFFWRVRAQQPGEAVA